MKFSDFEQINTNLWKKESVYYRLFGYSVTPNGCWLSAPKMVHLKDIDIATGDDVFSLREIELESGTVPSCYHFITRPFIN